MSQNNAIQADYPAMLDGVTIDSIAQDFEFYDDELPVAEVIPLLTTIWTVSQNIRSLTTNQVDERTSCYWLIRYILCIDLRSEEIENLLNGSFAPVPADKDLGTIVPVLKEAAEQGKFFNPLCFLEDTAVQLTEPDYLDIPNDLFVIALRALIMLADGGYIQPLTEETINGLTIMADAASRVDLSKFPPKHTSEIVAAFVNQCVNLQPGSIHLGLARRALRIIFEKLGRELSLKGSAMFVRAVNIDNPFYSPAHNTLLAKLVQPWSYWARRRRREDSLNSHELYLLTFVLSQTVPKTALVNVAQSRVEVMESIKLFIETQNLLHWMLQRTARISDAGSKCDLAFSVVQFLMFNHIIYGWCSGYGAGVNFNWDSAGERQLLWQLFNLDTVKTLLDVSVNYLQVRTWKSEFGVSRLQFARSTLECIVGVFRHTDLLSAKPSKYAFQSRIVVWIEKIVMAITPSSRDPAFMLSLRELSSFVAVMAATRRALDKTGLLQFRSAHDLDQRINGILEQQLIAGIELSGLTSQEVADCYAKLDTCVNTNKGLIISTNPLLTRSMKTEELYSANLLVEELIVRTVKSQFAAAEFLLQLVNAGRPDLAALWLFVLKKMIGTYSNYLGNENTWSDLSLTEQEVFKRNILIATTIIDEFLSKQKNGLESFHSRAALLGVTTEAQANSTSMSDLATLNWLSPKLEEVIRTEITKYRPTYGESGPSDAGTGLTSNQSETSRHSREQGTFTNSFESQVYGYVRDYLEKLRERGSVKSYDLRPNIRVFKCEIDLVVEIMRSDGSRKILFVECEGESWHSTFGVRNPLDDTKTKVKTSPVLWRLLGVPDVPTIIPVPHREFKARRGTEQRSYVESLLSPWLS